MALSAQQRDRSQMEEQNDETTVDLSAPSLIPEESAESIVPIAREIQFYNITKGDIQELKEFVQDLEHWLVTMEFYLANKDETTLALDGMHTQQIERLVSYSNFLTMINMVYVGGATLFLIGIAIASIAYDIHHFNPLAIVIGTIASMALIYSITSALDWAIQKNLVALENYFKDQMLKANDSMLVKMVKKEDGEITSDDADYRIYAEFIAMLVTIQRNLYRFHTSRSHLSPPLTPDDPALPFIDKLGEDIRSVIHPPSAHRHTVNSETYVKRFREVANRLKYIVSGNPLTMYQSSQSERAPRIGGGERASLLVATPTPGRIQ